MAQDDVAGLEAVLNQIAGQLRSLSDEPDKHREKITSLRQFFDFLLSKISKELNGIFKDLKAAVDEPPKQAADISLRRARIDGLTSTIDDLTSKIDAWKTLSESWAGRQYSAPDGVFVTTKQLESRKKEIASRDEEVSPEQPPSTKKSPDIPFQQPQKLSVWQKQWRLHDISGEQWYNTEQVKGLTGQHVPAGKDELSAFLGDLAKNKGNLPCSFSYLMIPNERDQSLNHFVTMHINEKGTEVTYLDSNGKPIDMKDHAVIGAHFPQANIMYCDASGEKVSHKDLQAAPHKHELLRVQYDNHNCGMYSTEFTKLLNSAGNNDNMLKAGIAKIKAIDPQDQRQHHAGGLRHGNSYVPPKTPQQSRHGGPKL